MKGFLGLAQRTYGTTDPGGVWHPVHRRECLTILLGTYAENGQCNRRTTNALYSVQPAYACASASPFLPIAICGSKSNQQPMYRPGSFRVSETDVPCTKDFFFAQVLCQFLKYMRDSTSNMCGERVHPCFQEQSYCRHQGDNIGGCQCRHKQAVPNTMQFVVGVLVPT